MTAEDKAGNKTGALTADVDGIRGMVALATNINLGNNEKPGNSTFRFDDFKLIGSKVEPQPENSFGPVLWTMYTLSNKTVKLMALLPPIGDNDNQNVTLQLKKGNKWESVATEQLEPASRTALLRLENWDDTKHTEYRWNTLKGKKMVQKQPAIIPEQYGKIR